MQIVAFDAAVQHGADADTKKMIEESGGDAEKLIELRRDYYQDEQGNTSSIANCFGLCFSKEAVGTVALKDVSMQMTGAEYKAMTQSTMMVASYAVGHGILRPECAVSLLHDGNPY